jgi:hypothetical protein
MVPVPLVFQITLYPRPENPSARANEPKPPRTTLPKLDSDEVDDDGRLELSPLKKPKCVERPKPAPEDDRRAQLVSRSGGGSPMVGGRGGQLSRGIIAKAPPPTASVPITRSATWRDRFTGCAASVGMTAGLRLPNSFAGRSSMISRSSRRH